ncbi:hypothetical protein L198_04530 [Cryptococcus wingfieldii CBS 7118]|uniref:Uncharacterized protein n=1 Tax=Cryptococcus wingfieldii CBS 7118 TaxID=1295528 RepID=A0A1E3J7J8_9TREE|nr:hypothetical protein L198_04530 [Cryptococcus wingfieldii CBS 7118]ODN95911.1 hypothetical protein L198_04530 [Cryptococcus wingfieldii CBS 7118]
MPAARSFLERARARRERPAPVPPRPTKYHIEKPEWLMKRSADGGVPCHFCPATFPTVAKAKFHMVRGSGHLSDRVKWPINTREYYLWMAKHGVSDPAEVMSLAYFCKLNRPLREEAGVDYAVQWAEKVTAWIDEYNRLFRPWSADLVSSRPRDPLSVASRFLHKDYPLQCKGLWSTRVKLLPQYPALGRSSSILTAACVIYEALVTWAEDSQDVTNQHREVVTLARKGFNHLGNTQGQSPHGWMLLRQALQKVPEQIKDAVQRKIKPIGQGPLAMNEKAKGFSAPMAARIREDWEEWGRTLWKEWWSEMDVLGASEVKALASSRPDKEFTMNKRAAEAGYARAYDSWRSKPAQEKDEWRIEMEKIERRRKKKRSEVEEEENGPAAPTPVRQEGGDDEAEDDEGGVYLSPGFTGI